MDLKNDTALITGSSGGIGEEFAMQLAKRGVNLVLVARRADKLAALRDRLLETHPGLLVDVIAADLAVPGSAAELASKVADLGRRIAAITTATNGLSATVLAFTPAQYDANHALLIAPRATLVQATADLKSASADIAAVVAALQ